MMMKTNNVWAFSGTYTCRRISFVIPVPWRSSVVSRQHFLNKVDGKELRPLFLIIKVCWKKGFTNNEYYSVFLSA
jgi:hypothetical protein